MRDLSIHQCLEEITLTLGKWFGEFQRINFNLGDAKSEGRPRTSVTKKKISDVKKILDEDRRIKLMKPN